MFVKQGSCISWSIPSWCVTTRGSSWSSTAGCSTSRGMSTWTTCWRILSLSLFRPHLGRLCPVHCGLSRGGWTMAWSSISSGSSVHMWRHRLRSSIWTRWSHLPGVRPLIGVLPPGVLLPVVLGVPPPQLALGVGMYCGVKFTGCAGVAPSGWYPGVLKWPPGVLTAPPAGVIIGVIIGVCNKYSRESHSSV